MKNNINPKILIVDNKPNMIVSLETVSRANVSKKPLKNAKIENKKNLMGKLGM